MMKSKEEYAQYAIDRKNQEIKLLKDKIFQMEVDLAQERKDRLAGEVVVCLAAFAAGIVTGVAIIA